MPPYEEVYAHFHSMPFVRNSSGTIKQWQLSIGMNNIESTFYLNRTELGQLRDLITRELSHEK